jgi:hypothetical protein
MKDVELSLIVNSWTNNGRRHPARQTPKRGLLLSTVHWAGETDSDPPLRGKAPISGVHSTGNSTGDTQGCLSAQKQVCCLKALCCALQ